MVKLRDQDEDIGFGNAFWREEEQPATGGKGVEMTLDVVENSELKQVNIGKRQFMIFIKDYFKKIIFFRVNWQKERVDGFKKRSNIFF